MTLLSVVLIPLANPARAQIESDRFPFTRVEDAYTDTLATLVVFVQFADDSTAGDPNVTYRQWPANLAADGLLPDYAHHLVAATPEGPFPDSTLSGYFYKQSQGRFVVYGAVYPEIIVTSSPNAAYHRPLGGYADVTREVINRLDARGINFRKFDHDRDGVLDNLIIILRTDQAKQDRRITYTGISCLHARCGGGVAAGPAGDDIVVDDVLVDWNRSGSFIFNRSAGNIDPQTWAVRMIAHEIGHDVWSRFFVHVPAIVDNDVPGESNRGVATRSVGYVLMAGAGGGADNRGDHTISAFERLLLGWISCPIISDDRQGVRLTDFYSTGGCRLIPYEVGSRRRYLILTNRQRVGYWDQYRRGGYDADGRWGRFELGLLRTTGLLAMITDGRRVDVLPADNTLDNEITNAAYTGDLWSPGDGQITPWTRPNVSGYAVHPPRVQPAWFAIDDIRYLDNSTTLVFDYITDFRIAPRIRRDSWIGPSSSGAKISGGLTIESGIVLTVETDLRVRGTIRVHNDAQLVIAPDAGLVVVGSILLGENSRVVVAGNLEVTDFVVPTVGAGMETRGAGTIAVGGMRR